MEDYKIKQIIEKLLKDKYKKRVTIMLSGSGMYIDEVFKILNKYKDVEFKYIESKNSNDIKELDKIKSMGERLNTLDEIEDFIEKSDLILIPFLTKNTLSKIATGIADNKLTISIQLAIMMNKNIIALNSSWNPENESSKTRKINLNSAYNKMLYSYEQRLIEFGVISIPIYEMNEYTYEILYSKNIEIKETKSTQYVEEVDIEKKYITRKDIEGKEVLHISKDNKFTHLAQEYILEKNINVIQK